MPGRLSDWVFNYGTFSFAQPHFVWRFVKGETDYELGVVPYALFYDTVNPQQPPQQGVALGNIFQM